MLNEINRKGQEPYFHFYVGYKRTSNKRTSNTNKQKPKSQIQKTKWWLPKRKGTGEGAEGKGGQTHSDGKRLDFEW